MQQSFAISTHPQQKPTLAESVRLRLTSEIVQGVLQQGERLDEIQQSHRMGVSRTPLREAIRQLASLGMLETRPHRGVVIAPNAAQALFETLAELEAACIRHAHARLSGAQKSSLLSVAHRGDDWLTAMHRSCGNAVLAGLSNTLWQPFAHVARTLGQAAGPHIATALTEPTPNQAETLMRDYVNHCQRHVMGGKTPL